MFGNLITRPPSFSFMMRFTREFATWRSTRDVGVLVGVARISAIVCVCIVISDSKFMKACGGPLKLSSLSWWSKQQGQFSLAFNCSHLQQQSAQTNAPQCSSMGCDKTLLQMGHCSDAEM